MYLPDTNVRIKYLNPGTSGVKDRMASIDWHSVYICSVVKAELLYGAEKSQRRDANMALLTKLFGGLKSLDFDDAAATIYGKIRADLSRKGTLIGPNDLLISSIAVANNATLVTHNTAEFNRVEGLTVEDWEN